MKKINYRHSKKRSRETRTLHSPLSQSEEDSKSQEFLNQIISFPKCVWIRWKDAATHGGPEWVYAEDAMKYCQSSPPIMNTIGFVMNETDEYIAVTDTIGPEETGSVNVIPKGMIINFTTLKGEKDGMSSC